MSCTLEEMRDKRKKEKKRQRRNIKVLIFKLLLMFFFMLLDSFYKKKINYINSVIIRVSVWHRDLFLLWTFNHELFWFSSNKYCNFLFVTNQVPKIYYFRWSISILDASCWSIQLSVFRSIIYQILYELIAFNIYGIHLIEKSKR